MNFSNLSPEEAFEWLSNFLDGKRAADPQDLDELRRQKFLHDESLLHFAAIESLYSEVSYLAAHGWECDVLNNLMSSPLIDAVNIDDHKMVALLLNLGADPNFSDDEGRTPLHHAYFKKRIKIIELLLVNGSDIHRKNIYGQIPEEES